MAHKVKLSGRIVICGTFEGNGKTKKEAKQAIYDKFETFFEKVGANDIEYELSDDDD